MFVHQFNYRASHYELIGDIYQSMLELVLKNEKFGKHNIYVGYVVIGLKKVRKIWSKLVNYASDDDLTYQVIFQSVSLVNILKNRLRSGNLKQEIEVLYSKLVSLLPSNLQLSLFAESYEFGWDYQHIPPHTYMYLDCVLNWFQKLGKGLINYVKRVTSQFTNLIGLQLALPWGYDTIFGL